MPKRLNWMVVTVMLLTSSLSAMAASDDGRGWWFSQRLQGTSNAAGVVLKTNSTLGYKFSPHVDLYAGVPVYFARPSTATAAPASPVFMNGMGNAFAGLLVSVPSPVLSYSSELVVAAPTGDRDRGFSTGHATVDWTNTFRRSISVFTPFASIGAANTISDTSFFVRPFVSKGVVGHGEVGTLVDVAPRVSIGGSGYAVRATGEQQIISKVVEKQQPTSASATQQPVQGTVSTLTQGLGLGHQNTPAVFQTQTETLGPAAIANDRGFSTWLSVRPGGGTDFQVGYSRSVTYQLNSLFFGVGVRVGH